MRAVQPWIPAALENADYWRAKPGRNVERDTAHPKTLQDAGWEVLSVSECETTVAKRLGLARCLNGFLTLAELPKTPVQAFAERRDEQRRKRSGGRAPPPKP